MITELNNENFSEQLKTGLKVVEFYARWCGFCHKQDVILRSMEKIWIGKVDADENRALAEKYNITSYPSFVIFKDGKPIDKLTGLHSKYDIMNVLMEHL